MTAEQLLLDLECADTSAAYQALLALETLSETSDALYPYTERFALMTRDSRYAVRVRGFRLFCRQALWDADGLIDRHLPDVLAVALSDEKPTAVRQALAALREVVELKPSLRAQVQQAIHSVDIARYRDSMQGPLLKDIRALDGQIRGIGADEQ